MASEKAPWVPPELIAHLDKHFPDRASEMLESGKFIRHRAGQVSVVRYLKTLAKNQVERALLGEETL